MLFHEIYSSYYNAVAEILAEAVEGTLTDRSLGDIVRRRAFSESVMTIPDALKSGTWPLLTADNRTPLAHTPTMPLTELQKRWLKSLLSDPRIRLFSPSEEGLEEVKPLYAPDTFVYFDRYLDGDPYEDEDYVRHFRTVLTALREKRKLLCRFRGRRGTTHAYVCIPHKLEYSPKDDKFRLIAVTARHTVTVNMARITVCRLLEPYEPDEYHPPRIEKRSLTLELTDDRNALERVMLHFSHLEKETRRIDGTHYRIDLKYYAEDETEILIRVLSFGPMLRAAAPEEFVALVKERLRRQQKIQKEI